jgi:hypothetical protein
MPYTINPHNHVKIWLSPDKDIFLPKKNQARMVTMRATNPQDTIYFFYDSELLTVKAQEELMIFCAKNSLIALDLRRSVFPACTDVPDKNQIVTCYNQEVSHLSEGGNLGAASDLVRLLTYTYGNYSDFDVVINTNGLPDKLVVNKPVLFNLGSMNLPGFEMFKLESVSFNGDVLIASACKEAEKLIKTMREGIYEHYSQNAFALNLEHLKRNYRTLCDRPEVVRTFGIKRHALREDLIASSPMAEDLQVLSKMATGCAPWQLRQKISTSHYSEMEQHNLYLHSVIYTTGASVGLRCIIKNVFLDKAAINKEIRPYSLAQYGLDKAFYSTNMTPFYGNDPQQTEEVSDQSWTKFGKMLLDKEFNAAAYAAGFFEQNNGHACERQLARISRNTQWKYYKERQGSKARPPQILLTLTCPDEAKRIYNYLSKHQIAGFKPLARVKEGGQYALLITNPDAYSLSKIAVMDLPAESSQLSLSQ